MTTQYERDQMRRAANDRRLAALVEAATASLPAIEDPDLARDLSEALKAYDLKDLRRAVAWADEDDARRQREAEKVEAGKRAFEELPKAPPRMQCEAHVARDMGRWTQFGRCEKVATYIVMDWDAKPRRERVACTVHARKFVTDGHTGSSLDGWEKDPIKPTHSSWYRMNRFCMEKDSRGTYCSVRVDQGSGLHPGKEHKFK